MHLNLIFDSSVSGAPAGFKSALNYAASQLDALITNPIKVNINVGWGEIGGQELPIGDLSEGGQLNGTFLSYTDLVQQLTAHASNAADRQELATLPAVAPANIPGYFVASAQEKAWGLIAPNSSTIDGEVGFSNQYAYAFNPNHRAVTGEYDIIGAAEQEITHAMGRIYSDGALELVDYTAPGVFADPNTGGYFSTDGGVTNQGTFAPGGEDTSDWVPGGVPDSFNAITQAGVLNPLSSADVAFMGTLGFSVHSPTPTHVALRVCHVSKMRFIGCDTKSESGSPFGTGA